MPVTDDELINDHEVSRWIGVSRDTVQTWRYRSMGPPWIKLGPRCVRYRRGDVAAWIASKGKVES